jgi:hypothetical protein
MNQGLLNAINQIFPNCPQRYCLRHIYANFQTAGFRGEELKKFMDAASYSYTQHGFDVAMDNMKEECLEAWEWQMKIHVATWARYAMDYNCKTDLVVNNLSEVFNRMILDIREKPVRTMLSSLSVIVFALVLCYLLYQLLLLGSMWYWEPCVIYLVLLDLYQSGGSLSFTSPKVVAFCKKTGR